MPNLRGPGEHKRRLYAFVIASIMLYGAPIWCESITQFAAKSSLKQINRIWKSVAIRVISGYRTVSFDAATLMARLPPITLLAHRKYTYTEVKRIRESGEIITRDDLRRIRSDADASLMDKWKDHLSRETIYGKYTIEAVLPHFDLWINRNHGRMAFRLTQILSNHGSFAAFRCKIRKAEHDRCMDCDELNVRDDANHTIRECPTFENHRQELINKIGADLDLGSIIDKMLTSKDMWNAVSDFANKVMASKEEAERNRENEVHLPSPRDSDSIDDGSIIMSLD